MEPIKLETIAEGEISKELDKIQLAVEGIGDVSYTSFKRLQDCSNEALGGLNRDIQEMITVYRNYVAELRKNEIAMEELREKVKQGTVSNDDFSSSQSRLSVQQADLKQKALELCNKIEQEVKQTWKITEAINKKSSAITLLNENYADLNNHLKSVSGLQALGLEKDGKSIPLDELKEKVKLLKEQYDIINAYEEGEGALAAREDFNGLKANGRDFTDFLNRGIDELRNKPDRTDDDNINLGWLYKTRDETSSNPEIVDFKQSLAEKRAFYKENLDLYMDYLQSTRSLWEKDITLTGKQKVEVVDVEIKDVKDEQQKNLDNLLKNYQSFTTKMASLDKDYQRDMEILEEASRSSTEEKEKDRYNEIMASRTNAYQTSLTALISDNSDFSKVLFGDMENLSRSALKKAINEAKQFVAERKQMMGELSPEQQTLISKIEKGIDAAEKESSSRLPEKLKATSSALSECAKLAEVFDSDLADVIQTAADVAAAAESIATGIAKMGQGKYLEGAASMLSGVTSLISGIGKRLKENKKVREEYEKGLVETYSKEIGYNAVLRERLRLQKQIGETSLEYFDRMQNELVRQQGSIQNEYDEVWQKLMGEEYISGKGYRHGTWFRKAKTWNEYDSLAGKSYEEIESLYSQEKLEGEAKILFERLKALKEEGANVAEMMKNLEQEMQQAWTGTTASSIADSIAQGLMNGKKSAADFANDFEGLMRSAMIQAIKMKYLEKPLQDWYAAFADVAGSENGLDKENIARLKNQYDSIIENAGKAAADIEKVTGLQLAPDAGREAIAKGIESMSQESANELNGRFSALQYITSNIDTHVSNIQSVLYLAAERWVMIEENTRYCRRLEAIEADIRGMKGGIDSMVNKGILMRTQ
ncbi:hypothetical protein ACGE0T_00745 [Parabacteroides sp. APC149_11_2_Y6]